MSMMFVEEPEGPELGESGAVHPGEVLRDGFLAPLDLSAYKLAQHLGVPQQRIADIVAGRRGISADTALRLGRFFHEDERKGARFWLALQARYDLDVALEDEELRRDLRGIDPLRRG